MSLSRLRRTLANFTVLIEGGIDPQPHPNYIEVFGSTPSERDDGEVAGAREDAPLKGPCMFSAPFRLMPSAIGNSGVVS